MTRSRLAAGIGIATFFGLFAGAAYAAEPVRFLTGPNPGEPLAIALGYLQTHRDTLGLTQADLADLVVKDHYRSAHNGVTHLYLRQRLAGVEVWNGDVNVNVARDGSVINLGNRFVRDLAGVVAARSPAIAAAAAVGRAAEHLGLTIREPLTLLRNDGGPSLAVELSDGGISQDPIPVRLYYLPLADGRVRLVWNVVIHRRDTPDWWNVRVDAATGAVLDKNNWTHDQGQGGVPDDRYLIIPLPAANPEEIPQTTVVGPADVHASPFGWHDIDGDVDPDFADTRGNNVSAQDDVDANDVGGSRPGGGATVPFDFDYPFDPAMEPADASNLEAAIVNLFYYNNVMHDVTWHYGFDEPAGNFQTNNYGNGGLGNDPVQADAQDGSGTDNANFSTPPDGQAPRMQMFVWTAPPGVEINSPGSIAGDYVAGAASFGAVLDGTGVTGDVVYVDDGDDGGGAGTVHDGCEPLAPGSLTGLIGMMDRGFCEFSLKVLNAENAGAIAAVVVNDQQLPNGVINMGPGTTGGNVTISSVMIGAADGDLVKAELPAPGVNLSMRKVNPDRDSDFDNGVIAHEYGHGISNRLTGGPANVNCLNVPEQAGEGWSDFWTMVLSALPEDRDVDVRGVGTYLTFEDVDTGVGIRNFPYTTDLALNPQTYADVGTTNVPHGVGEIWMSMVWEMYWELVHRYRFDVDVCHGDGGNNLAIQLVIDGMKLQPCNPTFVQARDAILLADQVNNGGANQCDIWRAFAKRGLGVDASTVSGAVGDETEDFDLPEVCTPMFADDFESGDLSAWSNAVPFDASVGKRDGERPARLLQPIPPSNLLPVPPRRQSILATGASCRDLG